MCACDVRAGAWPCGHVPVTMPLGQRSAKDRKDRWRILARASPRVGALWCALWCHDIPGPGGDATARGEGMARHEGRIDGHQRHESRVGLLGCSPMGLRRSGRASDFGAAMWSQARSTRGEGTVPLLLVRRRIRGRRGHHITVAAGAEGARAGVHGDDRSRQVLGPERRHGRVGVGPGCLLLAQIGGVS